MHRKESPDALFRFIKTISPDLRKLLKAYSDVYGLNSAQWKLFDFLYYLNEYDSEAVKAEFKDTNLSSLKYDTFQWLIKALRRLGQVNHYEVKGMVDEIDVTIQRRSYVRAFKMLVKAKKILREHEMFGAYKNLLLQENQLISKCFTGEERIEQLKENGKEYSRTLEVEGKLNRLLDLRLQYFEPARNLYDEFGIRDYDSIGELVAAPEVQASEPQNSFRARHQWLQFWRYHHVIVKRWPESLDFSLRIINLYREKPWLIQENREDYFKDLKTVFGLFTIQSNQTKSKEYLDLLEAENLDDPLIRLDLLDKLIQCKYSYWMTFGEGRKGEEAYQLLTDLVPSIEYALEEKELIMLYFWTLRFLVDQGRNSEAKKWVNKLLAFKKAAVKIDLQVYTRVLHLVVLFDEKDFLFMESEAGNYGRFVRKHRPKYLVAEEIISFLRKAHDYLAKGTFPAKLDALKMKIESLVQDPAQRSALEVFDFVAWMERIRNTRI